MAKVDRRRAPRREGDRRPGRGRALDTLQSLYEISMLLTAFDSVEETIPKVFAVVTRVLPLRGAVLVTRAQGTLSTYDWAFEALGADEIEAARGHAEASFDYLTDRVSGAAGVAAPRENDAVRQGRRNYIALPLVGGNQQAFGLLQLQGVGLGESDLNFFNVVANQIAIALGRKRAEQERESLFLRVQQARAEADGANRAKDEFLATLSHELRTPLSAILGWSTLLREGKLDAKLTSKALDVVHRSAMTQKQLIADILDVQSIASGQLRLELGIVDLTKVVESGIDTLKPAADAKQIELRLAADPDTGSISGDAHRLGQVVWNLLSNAIKFTPKGGLVQIRLGRVGDADVEIRVADSGPGIPANFLPHIFDRFRQADSSARRRHGGLGLGLAIVQHVVALHGGTVTAANSPEEGTGALFTVRLPRVAMVPAGAVAEVPAGAGSSHEMGTSAPSLEGLRVLVVDDSPDERILITQVLERWGAEVLVGSSAEEGLAVLARERPHVLVSDIGMPDEDGYVFLRRVRDLPADRGGLTPAVALTAYATESDRTRALAAGFQVHVAKPVEPAALAIVVGDLARRTVRRGR
jgi:signal transduction histidine kinase/ActR/RegA family two-component response regulator